LIFVGALIYLYSKRGTTAPLVQTQKSQQDISRVPTTRGGDMIKIMDIQIYPGSRKVDEIDMGPDGKSTVYMVKAEPDDVIDFYVNELKKLGVDISSEETKQQVAYTGTFVIINADKTGFIQIGTQKDENGKVGYQIVAAPVSE